MTDDPTSRDVLELLRGRFFGKYRGVVASILPDPTLRGRIQVIVPAVLGETIVWAMPCVPYAGRNVGFHMLPAIGAGVWVEFEAGDPSYPIWSGCYWAQGEVPVVDGLSTVKFIRTEKLTLRIDDALGQIVIQTLTGSRITINATSVKIQAIDIKASSGPRNISIDPVSVSTNDGAHEVT